MDYKLDNQLLFDFHIALCKYLYYEIPVIIEIKTTCFYNLYKIYVRNKAEIFIKLYSSKYEVFYSGKSIYINTKKRNVEELQCKLFEVLSKPSGRDLSNIQFQTSNNIQLLKEFIENRYLYVSEYIMFLHAQKHRCFNS